jgi:NADH-quinone oxidoreductase subunit L
MANTCVANACILLTIGLPWLGAVALWLTDDRKPKLQHTLAVGFSVAAGLAALVLLANTTSAVTLRIPLGGLFGDISFVPDGLGVFLAAVATVVGSLAVIFSVDYMHGDPQLGRYYSLVLLFIGAMAGLVLTNSLLFLFFFWEITAFCSYALISFYNDDPKAVAAGIEALIMTQVGGVGLLGGALVAFVGLQSYEIDVFLKSAGSLPPAWLVWTAFGFLIAAAAKSAQFPFQTWLPDAMEAPTPISALIHAATMVNAGVYLLARFYPAFAPVPGWRDAVIVVGVVSALLTAVMALVAPDLKRVLAYSTVSQLGYMVYAIGAGGVLASQFHLFSHAIFKALLFLGAGAVIHAVGTRDMREMGGLAKHMPFTRTVFVIGALALAGLPILNGFWSKELVLEAGLAGGPTWAFAAMVVGAGLTACYTFRFVWMVFYGTARKAGHPHDAPSAMRVSLSLLAVGTLASWLVAGNFTHMLEGSLPFHKLHALSLGALVAEVVEAPATWLALAVIALGLLAWHGREKLAGLAAAFEWLAAAARQSFGFEWINRQIVQATLGTAGVLRLTAPGLLNWNVLGIVGGLVVLLVLLAWGA